MIGSDVIVTVLDIRGDKVRLGIDCPKHIAVDREEVRLRPDYRDRSIGEGEA